MRACGGCSKGAPANFEAPSGLGGCSDCAWASGTAPEARLGCSCTCSDCGSQGFSEGAWGCSRYPSPPLSSPVVAAPSSCRRIIPTRLYPHRQPVRAPWKSSLRRRRCKTFRSSLLSSPVMSCIPSPQPYLVHPAIHGLASCPPRRRRAVVSVLPCPRQS